MVSTRILTGDCREMLKTLPDNSIHCVITSPPYWGLRDYGTEPVVWSGDPEHAHEWQDASWRNSRLNDDTAGPKQRSNAGALMEDRRVRPGAVCPCGAWLGSLGLEPTPELFVQHLVEVFREVRRVLRDDGSLWLNLGDSYAGSGKGPTGHNGIGNQTRRQGFHGHSREYESGRHNGTARTATSATYKAKDLMEIPSDVVRALRQDGWYLRSRIPWLKRNAMPESVTDRPATAVEYVFLFSKQARYYWDADAVRVVNTDSNSSRIAALRRHGTSYGPENIPATSSPENPHYENRGNYKGLPGVGSTYGGFNPNGRSRRNSDWFFESWQGLLLDEDDEPLALVVNPSPFREAHFATFPLKLVEPMVKASTSEKGVCATCGAPWARVSEKGVPVQQHWAPGTQEKIDIAQGRHGDSSVFNTGFTRPNVTTGWQPTCACEAGEPVAATVLDPFGGSGTTGVVANKFGRDAVLVELKAEYVEMQERRLGIRPAQPAVIPVMELVEKVEVEEADWSNLRGLPLFDALNADIHSEVNQA